jgi:hypothetical protein
MSEQNRSPGAGSAWVERTADADGERDDEEAGGDEDRHLNPAGLPKREQARGVMVGQAGIEQRSGTVLDTGHAGLPCAVGAAIESPLCFHSVADDLALAVLTDGRERMDGTF